jgi:phosphoglycerol transferase
MMPESIDVTPPAVAPLPSAASEPAVPPPPAPPRTRRGWLVALLAFSCTGLISVGFLFYRLDLGHASFRVPFEYGHDSFLIHSWVKTLLDTGWWMTTDRCGAPFGHEMYDFPTNPNLHFLAIKGLSVFTREPGVLMNVYYVLGFLLAGLTAHAALRAMRVSHPLAVLGGVLYAHQPYHYWRGIDHLFLGTYWMIPLVAVVLVWVFRNEPLLVARNAQGKLRPRANWRTLVALAILVAEGFDFPHYPVFGGLFLLVGGIAAAAIHRDRLPLIRVGVLLAVLVAAFVANMAPNLLYYKQHGTNTAPDHFTKRPWTDAEKFGLVPAQLFIPVPNHPVGAFDRVSVKYYSATGMRSSDGSAAMGLAGVIGFGVLVGGLLAGHHSRHDRGRLLFFLGLLLACGILIGTAGGFGTLFNLLSVTIVRTYERISIYLAMFCIGGFAVAADWLFANTVWRWGVGGRAAGLVLVGGLTVLGLMDQTPTTFLPDQAGRDALRREFQSDERFVRAVEERLPTDGMVFQLPYLAFGSYTNTSGAMEPYAHYAAYVHARTSRWSFGGMHGRPGEVEMSKIARHPTPELLTVLLAYGYSGVSIDRLGYADRAAALEAELTTLTGGPPLVSENARHAFFPLAGYDRTRRGDLSAEQWQAKLTAVRERVHATPVVMWGTGFEPEETSPDASWAKYRWVGREAKLHVVNPSPVPRRVRLRFVASTYNAGTWTVGVVGPNEWKVAVAADPHGAEVDREVELPPGESVFLFGCDAPPFVHPHRTIVFAVRNFRAELVE